MNTMRVDIIVTKRAGYGDEPAYWYWEAIGKDAGVKVRLDPDAPQWSASVPTPHDFHAYGVSLQVEYEPTQVANPDLWVEWLADALASAVVFKNKGMAGHFTITVQKCHVPEPEIIQLVDPKQQPDWPFATDVVPKDRIIPGDLTIAELDEYIKLSSKKGLRSAKQDIAYTVLDARYKGLDTVAAMKAYLYEWTTNDNVRAAVDWLVDQIPSRETKPA